MRSKIVNQKTALLVLFFTIWFVNRGISDSIPIPDYKILESTFSIKTDIMMGTAFVYNKDNIQYLVTAKHLFNKITKNKDLVFFTLNNKLINEPFNGTIYYHTNDSVDIAVIRLTKTILDLNIYDSNGKAILGQDVYFLGFPLSLSLGTRFNGIKLPLVKKATFSGSIEYNHSKLLLLDGFNVEGFSGGPVFTYDYYLKKFFLLGIISGYFYTSSNQNSGIIFCYYSGSINEIINSIK